MIDYFIICHDQHLILDFISKGSFANLPKHRFLFVDRPGEFVPDTEFIISWQEAC